MKIKKTATGDAQSSFENHKTGRGFPMESTLSDKSLKKHITLGILAHVDAGKTTLSESILYLTGSIRKLGRVDNIDAFLDTYSLERERGITIFSKQAELEMKDGKYTLLDSL